MSMDNKNKIEALKHALKNNNGIYPDRKVKVIKRDNGLFERTDNSTILITEDNKMVLND